MAGIFPLKNRQEGWKETCHEHNCHSPSNFPSLPAMERLKTLLCSTVAAFQSKELIKNKAKLANHHQKEPIHKM
jgi:hypothetical protein